MPPVYGVPLPAQRAKPERGSLLLGRGGGHIRLSKPRKLTGCHASRARPPGGLRGRTRPGHPVTSRQPDARPPTGTAPYLGGVGATAGSQLPDRSHTLPATTVRPRTRGGPEALSLEPTCAPSRVPRGPRARGGRGLPQAP